MGEYKTAHDFGAAASMEGYPDFEAEYSKLHNSELLQYEDKVESARCAADVGRILRTFKIKKNVEVTDNGKIII